MQPVAVSFVPVKKLVREMDGQQVSDTVEEFFRRIIHARNQWSGGIHLVATGEREIVELAVELSHALQRHGRSQCRWRNPVTNHGVCPRHQKLT